MEEPGRLQSIGSLRVGHDWSTSLSLFTFMRWRRKWQPTPVFLPGESQGRGSLVSCRLWGQDTKWLSSSSSMCVCVCVCVYGIFFILSSDELFIPSIDEYLGYFHILAMLNNVTVNIGCIYLFEWVFSLDICPRVGLLDHMATLFLVLQKPP